MFNSISSVMDTVPQCLYQYQESSFLWSFGIFLSNMFTNIKSIFSYLFMFFKQSRDKDNTINQVIQEENIKLKEQVIQEENTNLKEQVIQEENTNLKERVIQLENTNTKLAGQLSQLGNTNTKLAEQLSQSLIANNNTKESLTAYVKSIDESAQKNKELITLVRFERYLKSNRDMFIAIEHVITVRSNTRISLDYVCLSITGLTSKLSKLKDIIFAYDNESKSKLVFKYECEIKLQKKHMRDHNEPYVIDIIKNEYDGIHNKLISMVDQLINKQNLLLKEYEQVMLANDNLSEHLKKMLPNKLENFYSQYDITQQINNLNYLGNNIADLNKKVRELRTQHLDKLDKFNTYMMDILGLETVTLKYTMNIDKYKILVKRANSGIDIYATTNKLKDKEAKLPNVQKTIVYYKQQMQLINDDLVTSIKEAHKLLEKCNGMCISGKGDINNCTSILKKQYGINITTNKGPATQKPKGDTKEILLKKNQSSLINVSKDLLNTAKPSSDLANTIADSTYTE